MRDLPYDSSVTQGNQFSQDLSDCRISETDAMALCRINAVAADPPVGRNLCGVGRRLDNTELAAELTEQQVHAAKISGKSD
jgi:hypothetical protein